MVVPDGRNEVAVEAGSVVGSGGAARVTPTLRTSPASGPEEIRAPGWVPENYLCPFPPSIETLGMVSQGWTGTWNSGDQNHGPPIEAVK